MEENSASDGNACICPKRERKTRHRGGDKLKCVHDQDLQALEVGQARKRSWNVKEIIEAKIPGRHTARGSEQDME
jgi:hypothetical protein